VDDTATALLMNRFYRNLLGKCPGLSAPLPKAEALAEAKAWLRSLTADEAAGLTADLANGVARGKSQKAVPLLPPPQGTADAAKGGGLRPFGHPRCWAGLVLVGDPE
jgi:CHAT domain-containing protein